MYIIFNICNYFKNIFKCKYFYSYIRKMKIRYQTINQKYILYIKLYYKKNV